MRFFQYYSLSRLSFFSSKNEMDNEEFMFFLTGGVGLENKVT